MSVAKKWRLKLSQYSQKTARPAKKSSLQYFLLRQTMDTSYNFMGQSIVPNIIKTLHFS